MSDCCSDHDKKTKEEKNKLKVEKMPKSSIGKYLYKLGKEGAKKSTHKKAGCC